MPRLLVVLFLTSILGIALVAPAGVVSGQPATPNREEVDPEDARNRPPPPADVDNADNSGSPGHGLPADLETPTTNPDVDGEHDEVAGTPSQEVVYVVVVDGSASMAIPTAFPTAFSTAFTAGGHGETSESSAGDRARDEDESENEVEAEGKPRTRMDRAVDAARVLLSRLVNVATELQRHKVRTRRDNPAPNNATNNPTNTNNTTNRADDREPGNGNAAPNGDGAAPGNDAGNSNDAGNANDAANGDGDGLAAPDGEADVASVFDRYQAGDRFLLAVMTDRLRFWSAEPRPLTQAMVDRALDELSQVRPRGQADLLGALRSIAATRYEIEVFVISDDFPRPAFPSASSPRHQRDADAHDRAEAELAAHVVRTVGEVEAIAPRRRNWVRVQYVVDVDDAARQFGQSLATGRLLSMVSKDQFPLRYRDR